MRSKVSCTPLSPCPCQNQATRKVTMLSGRCCVTMWCTGPSYSRTMLLGFENHVTIVLPSTIATSCHLWCRMSGTAALPYTSHISYAPIECILGPSSRLMVTHDGNGGSQAKLPVTLYMATIIRRASVESFFNRLRTPGCLHATWPFFSQS
jgi:hypothetical protein